MSGQNENLNMPFNTFFKIFQGLFTMTLLTKMDHLYDQTKNKKLKLKAKI